MRTRLVILAAVLALTACKKEGGESTSGGGDATPTGTATPVVPLSAGDLRPVIREFGPDGVVPQKIVVEFAQSVVDASRVGRASDKTEIRLDPNAPGVATWTGTSTLTFVPSQPLAFETKYAVTIAKLETRDGVLDVSGPEWTHGFTTPSFGLVRVSPERIDLDKDRVSVQVVFSGPVAANVRSHLTWDVDGQMPDYVTVQASGEPHVLHAVVQSSYLSRLSKVRVKIAAGLPSATKKVAKAPAANGQFEISSGKPITIKAATLKEGTNGWYVNVYCDDESVEGGKRYFWDRDDYHSYYLSRRCELDESDAQEKIRFNPPVKFYTAPGQGGFRVFGDFKRGPYSMTIEAGTGSVDGGVLLATFDKEFSVPARKAQVSFVASGRYLPRSAWKNLAVNHMNVADVQLDVLHVPTENLIFWMSDESYETVNARTGNFLVRKQIPVKGEPDTLTTSWVDVASLVPSATKGVIELKVTAGGVSASNRILLTDMSLVAKKSVPPPEATWQHEVRVWALDIESTSLLSGAEVKLVRRSGKVMGRCTTSGEDGCVVKAARDDEDTTEPFALTAQRGDDVTYIRYSDLKTDTSDSDVAGDGWRTERVYRAAIWSDRGVYRPGETARLAAIVRAKSDVAPESGLPVEMRLTDPRGKLAKKLSVKTNEAGMLSLDLPFAAFAETGRWTAELVVAEKSIGSYPFQVEEFVPERMKVEATVAKPGYSLDEKIPVSVFAKYLFGGTADGNPVELTCTLEPSTFRPKENANFTYGVWVEDTKKAKTLTLGQVRESLDAKGAGVVECPPLTGSGAFQGPARVVANVAVFEAGSGRSTNGQAIVPVHPAAYYIGLSSKTKKFSAGEAFTVEGVVVDWDGKLAPSSVKEIEVDLVRLEAEYGYWWDEEEDSERWQRHMRPVPEGKQKVAVSGGKFSFDVKAQSDGDGFVVRAKSGDARTDLVLEGEGDWYWWYGEGRVDTTPKPAKPTSLALELPKVVKVGEDFVVKTKAPYAGKILFTAETDRVVAAEWKTVKAGEVTWKAELEKFAPNVYVSAFLVKDPHLESKESYLPDRAFGVASTRVEPVAFTQNVKLTAPEEVRSSSKLTVTLDVGKGEGATYATVAAVDEGILSLTRFKSPDPFEQIFVKRALGVETYETVGWTLLVPPAENRRSTGGDAEGGEMAGRVQPVKPVALWSGLVKVGDDGKATVTFDVPQYRGQLRVMAVTASAKKMGRASAQVIVKDPIVLSTTLPRFVTYGDELQIPVFVTNLSGATIDVKVTLVAENLPIPGLEPPPMKVEPIRFLGKPEGTARLENGKSGTLVFQAKANMAVGAAKLRVTAAGGGHQSIEELDVPFLPSGPRERVIQRVEVSSNEVDLAPLMKGWVPTTERSTFWLTSNPYGESFDHLKYLVRYPYGCIEQTTSSTRPLLFVSNLLDSVDPSLVATGKVEDMVMHGVNRVLSMQTPSGGFAYWQGGTEPTAWGTAYATHMLLDAQKAGYAVPQERLDDVIDWIDREVARYEQGGRAERGDHGWDTSSESYMHYVLALSGKGRKARVQRLIDELPKTRTGPQLEEEYMLKAALYLAGDRRYEKDLKNPDVGPVVAERKNDWSFYSDRRRRGFMLSTFQDLFGNDAAGEALASRVADSLKGQSSSWYTTQELVWGVTGLGKRVQGGSKDFKPGKLIANGKALEGKGKSGSDRTWAITRASEYSELKLKLDDKGSGKVYVLASSEGVKTAPTWKTGGEGLELDRTYRTISGDRVDPASGVTLADMVFVEITLTNKTGTVVRNISLVDRLPAGFEIENPRLGRGTSVEWLDPSRTWNADYMDVRDDKIAVFGTLQPGESRKVVYGARAVTAGKFTVPPCEAEAMYDPSIWAREGGTSLTIEGPWEDFLL